MYYIPVHPQDAIAILSEAESFLMLYGLYVDKTWANSVDKHHYHDYFQLYYTISGEYTHTINGVRKLCTAGDVSLIMPYTVHGLDTTATDFSKTRIITVSFLPNAFSLKKIPFYPISYTRCAYKKTYLPTSMTLSGEDKLRADEIMNNVYSEHEKHANMFITTILRKLTEFFDICSRSAGVPVRGMSLPDRIACSGQIYTAANHIKHNAEQKLSIEDAAMHATMSRSTFTKNFREVTGMSYHDLHMDIRLAKAITEMRYSRKSIAEISDELGFSSQAHFTKVFISAFSIPPLAFRKKMIELERKNKENRAQRDNDTGWAYIRSAELRREHYMASIGEDYY